MRDRRSSRRIPGSALPSLTALSARSPTVEVVDISDGGALIETAARLKPGEREVFLFRGATAVKVAASVMRSEVTRLIPAISYRSAIRFATPLALQTLGCDVMFDESAAEPRIVAQPSAELQEEFRRLIEQLPGAQRVRVSAEIAQFSDAESLYLAVPDSSYGTARVIQVFFAQHTTPTLEQFDRLRELAVLASGLPDCDVAYAG